MERIGNIRLEFHHYSVVSFKYGKHLLDDLRRPHQRGDGHADVLAAHALSHTAHALLHRRLANPAPLTAVQCIVKVGHKALRVVNIEVHFFTVVNRHMGKLKRTYFTTLCRTLSTMAAVSSPCDFITNWKSYTAGHFTRESISTPGARSWFSVPGGGSNSPRRARVATSNLVAPYSLITSPVFSSMSSPSSRSLSPASTEVECSWAAAGRTANFPKYAR